MESSKPKLLNCMIVGVDKETSEEFAKSLFKTEAKEGIYSLNQSGHEFQGYARWPDCPKGLPGFSSVTDAIIIRVKNSKEWDKMSDFITARGLIHFRLVVQDQGEEIARISHEVKPNAIFHVTNENKETLPDEILNTLIKAEEELESLLKSVFQNFDKSGDGFIDVDEMELMCKELGVDVTHADFTDTLRALDVNHDGKISYEEFTNWWRKGRQVSKLMETLISMRLATSTFFSQVQNSKYLSFIQQKLKYLEKEKKTLINSFVSLNLEKVKPEPEIVIGIDGYFGGDVKNDMSKAYISNYEEGLKPNDIFFIIEFIVRDPSKLELMIKFLTLITDAMREGFRSISRRIFHFMTNDVSIKVIRKNNNTIGLSFKIRKVIKEELLTIENAFKSLLDEEITQTFALSFCLGVNLEKIKQNPQQTFIETSEMCSSLQFKSEILKKNFKLLKKYIKQQKSSTLLNFIINAFNGGSINLNFTVEHLKSSKNSIFNQQNQVIVQFLKQTLIQVIQDFLSSFGGFSQFKKFYDAVKENYTIVINSPQFHILGKIDLSGLSQLFE
jgi:hypothetical protein